MSISLAAIHTKRTERWSVSAIRLSLTRCQRTSESAVAQPTHEPVCIWSPTSHHGARRSTDAGSGPGAATVSDCNAWSSPQSSSVFCDGMQFRIRFLGSTYFGIGILPGDWRRAAPRQPIRCGGVALLRATRLRVRRRAKRRKALLLLLLQRLLMLCFSEQLHQSAALQSAEGPRQAPVTCEKSNRT